MDKLNRLDYESLCYTHFGQITGATAKNALKKTLTVTEQWWHVFERAEREEKLEDIQYVTDLLVHETGLIIPTEWTDWPVTLGWVLQGYQQAKSHQ